MDRQPNLITPTQGKKTRGEVRLGGLPSVGSAQSLSRLVSCPDPTHSHEEKGFWGLLTWHRSADGLVSSSLRWISSLTQLLAS